MQVNSITTTRVSAQFGVGPNLGGNRVDLLTGPNGAGKTEVLAGLALAFGGGRLDERAQISWSPSGASAPEVGLLRSRLPARVIAQTFSPFSRFMPPSRETQSITSKYSDGPEEEQRYVTIGLHRRSFLSRPARGVLEDALFRLSESNWAFDNILKTLGDLGFGEFIDLAFVPTVEFSKVLRLNDPVASIARLFDQLEDGRTGAHLSTFVREMERIGRWPLQELLVEALKVVLDRARRDKGAYGVIFGFHPYSQTIDYAVLQSLALLRRLRLVSLRHCKVKTNYGDFIDISDASSGQQQMLCSILGLATAITSNALVLIDEPELSLHPQWQLAYMDHLAAILRSVEGCHVLVATHSPLIVQRGQAIGADVVALDHGLTRSFKVERQSSVESALLDVFETPISESKELASLIFSIINQAEGGGDNDKALRELNKLRSIYEHAPEQGGRSLKLILDAISLLEAGSFGGLHA